MKTTRKNDFVFALLTLLVGFLAFAQGAIAHAQDAEAEFKQAAGVKATAFEKAVMSGKPKRLEAVFAPGFTYTDHFGNRHSRQHIINDLADTRKELKEMKFTVTLDKTKAEGDTGIATVTIRTNATVKDSKGRSNAVAYVETAEMTCKKTGAEWALVSGKCTDFKQTVNGKIVPVASPE